MKKIILLLLAAVSALSSCSKNENITPVGDTKEAYIDATSKTTWNYYSLSENKIVGTGEENEADNAKWAARTDWDIAVKRYNIRTNSGEFTKANAKGGVYIYTGAVADGGVYIYDDKQPFTSITNVPSNAIFETDKTVTYTGMGGTTTTIQSNAETIKFKMKLDEKTQKWTKEMPPVYMKAPLCIFKTANGNEYYKVEFTQYMNEEGKTGHIKFNLAQIQ